MDAATATSRASSRYVPGRLGVGPDCVELVAELVGPTKGPTKIPPVR